MAAARSGPAPLEVEVRPPWPFRLPSRGGGVIRVNGGVVHRLLHVEGEPVVVQVWRRRDGPVSFRASPAAEPITPEALEVAVERMRFALGVDDDYRDLYDAFRGDRLLRRAISRRPWIRPRRQPSPWQALLTAVTKQLIEAPRAAEIQRRIVRRWGPSIEPAASSASRPGAAGSLPGCLRDVPGPEVIAGVAPAELASMDLAPSRALALIKCARETAADRADLADPEADRRLLAIPEVGPWTVQCLGLYGRGEADSLPAGDLGYLKLIGRLSGNGRRATVEEVEDFFAPYAPYRGLAGTFILTTYHGLVAKGRPLRLAA